jgi:acetyltransferase
MFEASMDKIFFPRSIVIFGVSDSPSNLARVIPENLDRFGFEGAVYLVGGKADCLRGRKVLTNVNEIPEVPDLAVFLVPADRLADGVDACGKKGIRRIVIETGGFSEFCEDRKDLEGRILEIAARWQMKVMGPNCVGVVNIDNGLTLPFFPLNPHEAKPGPVSIISQSGGLVHDIMMLCHMEDVGIRKCVSIGNKLMLGENDFLEYLLSDPTTGMIGIYLENIRNGRRLMDLAASTSKPIILVKSNRSPGSSEIARFHTSSLAGDDRIVDEAMKQAGIHRVQGVKEMVDCFKIFSLPLPEGQRLAVVGRSGGHAVLSADSILRHGFRLASLSDQFFNLLSDRARAGVIRRTNPLDLGDVFDIKIYLETTERALQERGVDAVLVVHSYPLGEESMLTRQFISSSAALTEKYQKPVVFCMIGHREDWFPMRDVSRLPIFAHVDDALMALSIAFEHSKNRSRAPIGYQEALRCGQNRIDGSLLSVGVAPVEIGFDLLRSYGLDIADYRVAEGVDETLKAAQDIGYPVVLKTASRRILHKTDEGGVILDVRNGTVLKKAIRHLKADAYLVQKMVSSGCEMIIGGRNDPQFGPVILCGFGGIFAEVYGDSTLRVVPINAEIAVQMVERLKGAGVLKGLRGQEPYDVEYLVSVLVNVSRLLLEHQELKTIDINPLILLARGKGGLVVDAKLQIV